MRDLHGRVGEVQVDLVYPHLLEAFGTTPGQAEERRMKTATLLARLPAGPSVEAHGCCHRAARGRGRLLCARAPPALAGDVYSNIGAGAAATRRRAGGSLPAR